MRHISFIAILIVLQFSWMAGSNLKAETIKIKKSGAVQAVVRDPFLYPYAPNSAFNRVIGTGAEYSEDDSPLTIDIREVPKWGFNTKNGWAVAVTKSKETDPLVTVTCSSTDINRNINFPYQLRIPEMFPLSVGVPETSDGQIVIYDEATGITHEFYKFKWNNGKPTADIHRTDDPNIALNPANPTKVKTIPDQNIVTGLGHGTTPGQIVGSRAVGTACLAGLLRTHELTEPDTYPQHAIALELAYAQLSATAVQWPAVTKDYTASQNTGNIPYGALVAIPPQSKGGPDLSTLGLTEEGMRIAKALVYYGGIVTDRRGTNAGIEGDQYIPSSVVTNVQNDLNNKLIRLLRVVTNNTKDQAVSGGGVSLLEPTTDVSTGLKNSECVVYPNPAKESLNINVSQSSEVTITDLTARVLVRKSVAEGLNRLNLNLKPGIYLLHVMGADKLRHSSKLVIE